MAIPACELCSTPGGAICWQDEFCRVVLVQGADVESYPGFCRVIWRTHVAEMSDLAMSERAHLMGVVFATESALRALCRPDKINLASLGNVVPHLHWHVIARYRDDAHFPAPIWTTAVRPTVKRAPPKLMDLSETIAGFLRASSPPGS